VIACWPSDAGHDYEIREGLGFGGCIVEDEGTPVLIKTED
jgi:hypothetical protein